MAFTGFEIYISQKFVFLKYLLIWCLLLHLIYCALHNDFWLAQLPLPLGASLVAQTIKNLPAMQETQVWSLGWDDPLEKRMAIHSSILAWRIPWTEAGYDPWGHKESDMIEQLTLSLLFHNDCHCIDYFWHFCLAVFYFLANVFAILLALLSSVDSYIPLIWQVHFKRYSLRDPLPDHLIQRKTPLLPSIPLPCWHLHTLIKIWNYPINTLTNE